MRALLVLLLALSLSSFAAFADTPVYKVVKEKSSLKFFAIENNAPIEGKFKDFNADIRFDENDLKRSRIKVRVQTSSLEVANEDVSKNIRLPEWLSIEAFPTADFESTEITRMPYSDNYYANGKLTLRGKTMPAVLNFQLREAGNNRIAEGYVTLHRTDFGVGQGQWAKDDVIKNEVRVEFRIYGEKQAK